MTIENLENQFEIWIEEGKINYLQPFILDILLLNQINPDKIEFIQSSEWQKIRNLIISGDSKNQKLAFQLLESQGFQSASLFFIENIELINRFYFFRNSKQVIALFEQAKMLRELKNRMEKEEQEIQNQFDNILVKIEQAQNSLEKKKLIHQAKEWGNKMQNREIQMRQGMESLSIDYTNFELSKFLETCDVNIQKLNIEQLMKQYP